MFRTKTSAAAILLSLLAGVASADAPTLAAGQSIQIESVAQSGRLLRVEDAKSANGTPIVLYPNQAWKCMTWQLQADGEGFRLRNHFTNKTFGPAATATEGTRLVQRPLAKEPMAEESLKFVAVSGQDGIFQIIHAASGLAIEAGEDGKVVLKKLTDSPAQRFRLLDKPEHFTG